MESLFDYLQVVCGLAKSGDKHELEEGAFDYARAVLQAAEQPMKKLGVHEGTENAINEAEKCILANRFDEANQILLSMVKAIMEKSGTKARLHQLYGKASND